MDSPPHLKLMDVLNIGCLNVHGLKSKWKQGLFLNDFMSHRMDIIIATEFRLFSTPKWL